MKRSLLLKIWLSALILFSAQLILVSPLHDHEDSSRQHIADCTICKLYSGDHLLPADTISLPVSMAHGTVQASPADPILRQDTSPYQGRAPPLFSL